MNAKRKLRYLARRARGVELDDVLESMGLMRRRSAVMSGIFGSIGFLTIGAAVGAGIALMFAPATGKRTRQTVEERLASLRDKIGQNRVSVSREQQPH